MPGSIIVRAAIFTAGAVVGGCIATAVSNNQSRPAAVELDGTGKTTISTELSNQLPILKYGNPGK